MDASLSIMVLGICAFWCQQLVEAGWDYIDGTFMALLCTHDLLLHASSLSEICLTEKKSCH